MAVTADQIRQYLTRKGSPLARYANDFVQVGAKYGIDPRFLVAISGIETSFGTAGSGLANPFGYMSAKRFSGPREVLERMGNELTKQGGYYSGKDTIDTIGATWAPPGAENDAGGNSGWPAAVRKFFTEMGGNPSARVKGSGAAQGVTGPVGSVTENKGQYSTTGLPRQQMVTIGPEATQAIQNYMDTTRAQVLSGQRPDSAAETMAVVSRSIKVTPEPGRPGDLPGADPVAAATGAVGASSQLQQQSVKFALAQKGEPYVWGGTGPNGWDCSGLMQAAWAKAGKSIPRVTYDQWKQMKPVQMTDLQPGDLVFSRPGPSGPEHVVMYIGDGNVVEAPRTGLTVRVVPLASKSQVMGARRPG